jgi:hypothetical protein
MAPKHDIWTEPTRTATGAGTGNREDLAARIESHVEGKALGRVRDLHVVCRDNVIILQGRARTQHDKQIAQEAVFDVADTHAVLTNQIVVRCG